MSSTVLSLGGWGWGNCESNTIYVQSNWNWLGLTWTSLGKNISPRARSLDPFINENDCYIHAGALKMTAPILWVPARMLLLLTREFVQPYSSSPLNLTFFPSQLNRWWTNSRVKYALKGEHPRGVSEIHSISMLSLPEPPRGCNILFHHVTVGVVWTAIIMSNPTLGWGYVELWLGWGFDN